MIRVGPFQKFQLRNQLRLDPNARLHFLNGEGLTPSPGMAAIKKIV
jgi:hypothetical protein